MDQQFWAERNLALSLSDQKNSNIRKAIHDRIKSFNDEISSAHREARAENSVRALHILLRDRENNLVGGLIADTYWNWLDVDDFWLDESVRGQGIGRIMLLAAEREAIKRGCRYAKLETFSFQARGFYERCGYEVVGRLDEYPPGQAFYWMQKALGQPM